MKTKFLFLSAAILILLTFKVDLNFDNQNNLGNSTLISVENAVAQESCNFNCLTNIEKTTSPEGTQRYKCDGFCGCELIWTIPENWGHGKCSLTDPGVG